MKRFMTKKAAGLFVIFLILFLVAAYFKLGGFNKLQIDIVDVNSYRLVGRYFEGNYRSDTLAVYFEEMKIYLDNDRVQGDVVIIYDQEPSGYRGKCRSFVGIRLSNYMSGSLDDLVSREIQAQRSIRVAKDAHIAVMPKPDKIRTLIEEYASLNSLKIAPQAIEIYYPNHRLVIEQPIL